MSWNSSTLIRRITYSDEVTTLAGGNMRGGMSCYGTDSSCKNGHNLVSLMAWWVCGCTQQMY